jgi:hypothetical protein
VTQQDAKKRQQDSEQAGTVFEKNREDGRILAADDFIPGALARVFLSPELEYEMSHEWNSNPAANASTAQFQPGCVGTSGFGR